MERVTVVCFLASYAVALGLEVLHQFRPRPLFRLTSLGFGAAGFLAQTIYLAVQRPPLAWQFGWMLFLAWILAIFYLYGSIHHHHLAWGVFVLPLVLGLVILGSAFGRQPGSGEIAPFTERFWGRVHAALLLLAAVGLCVGFLASLMYLVQAHRLRAKRLPGQGMRLLSLERLEGMNRRAITLAFPLLTLGMVLGAVLLVQAVPSLAGWTDPRVLGTGVLWLTCAVLFHVRYGYHLRGRRVAFLTIAAFVLLVVCLSVSHPVGKGGGR
jgi:ABC-type transport system involved in cytochrome c biogenesis permease subunit